MRTAVIGGGGWGTCLARLLAAKGHPTSLWVYEPDLAVEMNASRENRVYLPRVRLPPELTITASLGEATARVEVLVLAVPCPFLRQVLREVRAHVPTSVAMVIASKGLDAATLGLPTTLVLETLPRQSPDQLGALSGPSFAAEVARGQPTTVALGTTSASFGAEIQQLFTTPAFTVEPTNDLIGVQLGGAIKHVVAIAAGASEGLGFGENARAVLVSRGVGEMLRLGAALGAERDTLSGVAGLGDLVLTCAGPRSRHWQLGYMLARGRTLEEARRTSAVTLEGLDTTRAALALSRKHRVSMPLVEQVHRMLFEGRPPRDTVGDLVRGGPADPSSPDASDAGDPGPGTPDKARIAG
jgi:glycerol-3-phosphate dehydrogenase (NAD(P)+)